MQPLGATPIVFRRDAVRDIQSRHTEAGCEWLAGEERVPVSHDSNVIAEGPDRDGKVSSRVGGGEGGNNAF